MLLSCSLSGSHGFTIIAKSTSFITSPSLTLRHPSTTQLFVIKKIKNFLTRDRDRIDSTHTEGDVSDGADFVLQNDDGHDEEEQSDITIGSKPSVSIRVHDKSKLNVSIYIHKPEGDAIDVSNGAGVVVSELGTLNLSIHIHGVERDVIDVSNDSGISLSKDLVDGEEQSNTTVDVMENGLAKSAVAYSTTETIEVPNGEHVAAEEAKPDVSVAVATTKDEVEETDIIAKVDDLFAKNDPQAVYDMITPVYKQDEALHWRYVKCHYELFSKTNDGNKALQEEFLRNGIELADEGLQEHNYPNSGYLLKWKAILLGKLGNFQPTKEKMENSFLIRDNLEAALGLLPEPDASVYQALGEWCFKVAKLSFLERQVASVLFGTPPAATYQQAWEIRPTTVLAQKIIDTYEKMGGSKNRQLVEDWKNKARAL